MKRLPPPVRRYLLGKLPTHCGTKSLGQHYLGIGQETMESILLSTGLLKKDGKPSKEALNLGYLDVCENSLLWNLSNLETLLKKAGLRPERVYANQALPDVETGKMVTLGVIASYFAVGGPTIGKWLTELGFREVDKAPTKEALSEGLAEKVEFKDGQAVRTSYKWDLAWALGTLTNSGHPLDHDFEASLKGKGGSSDVEITTVASRAKKFAEDFAKVWKRGATRKEAPKLVREQPRAVVEAAEKLLGRPGWIASGDYLREIPN